LGSAAKTCGSGLAREEAGTFRSEGRLKPTLIIEIRNSLFVIIHLDG
jgi:hypothetical protein